MLPISGLLITLDADHTRRSSALAALQQHPAIEVGDGEAHRVPIVVDTPSSNEDRAVWDWLHEQPGIAFVDLVYVHFDEGVEGSDGTAADALRTKTLDPSVPSSLDPVPHHARGDL